MTTWLEWAVATLAGIKAPNTPTNIATLKGWSTREKGGWPSIQWNNPLNTTEPWTGAVDSGAQPGAHDVKIYPSLAAGAAATVVTLIGEPYYPAIVANLRASLPASWWEGAARKELDTWGTGQSWLDSVPLTGDVMAKIDDIYSAIVTGKTVAGSGTQLLGLAKASDVAALTAAVTTLQAALPTAAGGLTVSQATELSDALAAIKRIETGLRGA